MRIPTLVKSILERLSKCPKPFKIAACFFLLGLVAAIDYATGVEISVSAFYPIPVVFMAWIAGRRSAVGMAALAAFTQLALRIAGEPGLFIRPVFLWNASMELGVYAGLALALGALRDAHARESLLARRDPLTATSHSAWEQSPGAASSVRLTRSWPKWTASCTRRRGAEGVWRERHNPR